MPSPGEIEFPAPYREYRLGPPLSRYVECVWFLRASRRPPGAAPDRIFPDGCVEILVQLADSVLASRDGRPFVLQPAAFVMGPFAAPLLLDPVGRLETLGIRFRPAGAAAFLPIPLDLLAGTDAAVDLVFGRSGAQLVETLRNAPSDLSRVRWVERFLLLRLTATKKRSGAAEAAVSRMLSGPRFSVSRLARESGRSTRQIERRFRADVGLPPRLLARIIRFQRVFRSAGRGGASWISVALDCGYSDQAHLIRDFREFAGQTPSAFAREGAGLGSAFLTPERLDRFFEGKGAER